MNLRHFNLNLLVVFEAMMSQRSTTRAGQILGLSQSAISNSLAQLRLAFDDQLFVRHKNEMVPTQRAYEIAGSVSQALAQIRALTGEVQTFDPATSERTFRIGMNDYSAFVLLGGIVEHVRAQSSTIKICVHNIGNDTIHQAIDSDDADLCIAFDERDDPQHETQVLFEDEWVCASQGAGRGPLSLADYLEANHVVIGTGLGNHVDRLLKTMNLERVNRVSLPFCLAAPVLVEGSDLMLTLPRRLAHEFSRGRKIDIRRLPFRTHGFPVSMVWHSRRNDDAGLTWLRNLIASTTLEESLLNVA
ncbi:LysR family transcriptional regulator [Acuticoccus sp. M5D2P5]|uniref:LysR family transcriptional regulator n=1 Tax=Acuticoccus kalidii TaxID=2910977 RepID=UPI001F3DDDDE|nr:LysR family transcriptional regulator [Acuticoccus kalidii]MCF3934942.1 LysR family transcriptional regulator [Acuticoccus kalidii]